MSSSPVTTTEDEKLSTIESHMREGNFRCAPVLDQGHLVGMITDRDIRSHQERLNEVSAKDAMSERPVTVAPTTPLHDAARLLFEQKIDALPVLEDGRLVGVMTTSDILQAFLDED
jgi:acetoin utilization protein AcuB